MTSKERGANATSRGETLCTISLKYAYMHACVRECVRGRDDECCRMRLSERSASDSGLEREQMRLLRQDKEA